MARPRRETGRPQESIVDVVMNASARGHARAGPPMTMFRLCGLVRWVLTGRRMGSMEGKDFYIYSTVYFGRDFWTTVGGHTPAANLRQFITATPSPIFAAAFLFNSTLDFRPGRTF